MAQSEQQRQRKLAKKKSKNREKHKQIARTQQRLASMAGKMEASSRGTIVYCGICGNLTQSHIGQVVIARQAPSRQVATVWFLVDTACLGVKDAFATLRGPTETNEIIEELEIERDLRPASPGLARGLVEAAVAYARSLGFEPHADYRKAAMIWGDIKPESIEGHYKFGREGKPFYTNGPYEDQARQQHIIRTLERTVGIGNFHYMLGFSSVPNGLPDTFRVDNRIDVDAEDDDDDDFDDLTDTIDATEVHRVDEPHP